MVCFSISFNKKACRLPCILSMGVSLGKSTSSVLLTTFHLLQFAETVHDLGIALFDFKKTFDTVPHLIVIVRKLSHFFVDKLFL